MNQRDTRDSISVYLMALLYLAAGINHFVNPPFYLKIMPSWLPFPRQLVFISGLCEILFAFLLMFRSTRSLGACLIILLLIAVFPANIQMAINYHQQNNPHLWIALLRLPLQALLIWWAYSIYKKSKRSGNRD